ncbi:organic cation transporter protein [Macrosteles quadrilineatus]|uniref:organic cation transporter protein n=1 Tax=Macrosteles quadrilineatus TaxID=74068 RepID=UPI0023E172FC|nr:organic cation transporter protein [Macrosteles quadrilineatus]
MGQDEDLEGLMGHLGEFGTYQMFQFSLHILAAMTAGVHMLSLVTVAAVPDHRCHIPSMDENDTLIWNDTFHGREPEELSWYIPPGTHGNLDNCRIINRDSNNQSEMCDTWVYDTQYYKSSRGMEWNFVCRDRWKGALAKSSYMFGVFAGAVTLGSMADKYGRKTIFYISAIMQLLLGVGVAFITEYYLFLAITFLYGIFGSAGSYITGFVLTMEIVGASKRTICGITFQAMFAFGVMLVAFWGFLIEDRVWLQVVYGLHSVLLLFHWWLIDESPRWLWSQGRISEAVTIVEKGVKMNGGEQIDKAHYVSRGKVVSDSTEEHSYSVLDMFRTPKLRIKSLNVCLNWFANSLVYYGLSLNTGSLAGNPYFILFIMGVIEMPSYVISVLFLDRAGRRCLTASFLLLGGFACLITAFTPKGSSLTTSIVFLGKFCIAGSFAIIYNYSAELFPTVIRNTALGVGSMCARFSAALTPLIALLDSFDPRVPTVLFAVVALVSGFLTTLLPETLDQPMPQSLDDGEHFGEGDTCFTTGCFGSNRKRTPVPLTEMS